MATIAPFKPTNAGLTPATFAASAPAGDVVTYPGSGSLLIEFDNGHASSITISIAPTQAVCRVPGAGAVTIPTRSVALAAGAKALFLFTSDQIAAYLNPNRQIPLAYTSGNAALTVRAIHVP